MQDYKQNKATKPKLMVTSTWVRLHATRYLALSFLVAIGFILHLNNGVSHFHPVILEPSMTKIELPPQRLAEQQLMIKHSFYKTAKKLGLSAKQIQQFVQLFPDTNFNRLPPNSRVSLFKNQDNQLISLRLSGAKELSAIYSKKQFYLPGVT